MCCGHSSVRVYVCALTTEGLLLLFNSPVGDGRGGGRFELAVVGLPLAQVNILYNLAFWSLCKRPLSHQVALNLSVEEADGASGLHSAVRRGTVSGMGYT